MTSFHLAEHAWLTLQAGTWLGAGALIGALYFLSLHWNVRMLALGRTPLLATPLLAMALVLGRFVLLAGVLAAIASRFGALPLLLAAAGILVVRTAAVRLGELT